MQYLCQHILMGNSISSAVKYTNVADKSVLFIEMSSIQGGVSL